MNNNNVSYQSIYSTQIYLNSSLVDLYLNGTSKSNVTFFFKDVLRMQRNTIETRLSVVSAEFPISWYLINQTNNNIIITIGGITTSYSFPIGNYNVNTFISMWNTTFGNNWAITYNKLTNIFQFSYSGGQFTFNSSSLMSVIGFPKSTDYTSSGNVLTALYPFNFYGIPRINIRSSTFNLKNVDSNERGQTRTIASVPVNSSYGNKIFYTNYTHYKSIIKNDNLQSINIEIQDDNYNYINFNNVDWTITLQVDVVNEVVDNLDTLEDVYNQIN
jgi:hypothetical protein